MVFGGISYKLIASANDIATGVTWKLFYAVKKVNGKGFVSRTLMGDVNRIRDKL